jgi:hypothetical protein
VPFSSTSPLLRDNGRTRRGSRVRLHGSEETPRDGTLRYLPPLIRRLIPSRTAGPPVYRYARASTFVP